MKGYKAFYFDLSCRPTSLHVMRYEIGKTYKMEGPLILCCRGFHFCPWLHDVYSYYRASFDTRVCEVETLDGDWEPKSVLKVPHGKQRSDNGPVKIVTDTLHVIRELAPVEIKEALINDAPKHDGRKILRGIYASLQDFGFYPEAYSLWKEAESFYRTACSEDELKALHERADLWEAALSGMPFVKEKKEKKE